MTSDLCGFPCLPRGLLRFSLTVNYGLIGTAVLVCLQSHLLICSFRRSLFSMLCFLFCRDGNSVDADWKRTSCEMPHSD